MKTFSMSSFLIWVVASLGLADFVQSLPENSRQTPAKQVKLLSAEEPITVTKCPQSSKIAPCSCSLEFSGPQLRCEGPGISQMTIENTFRETREVNGIPEIVDRGIHISSFLLNRTELTQLDLAPFYGSKMYYLKIQNNPFLTQLVTSGDLEDHGSIRVREFLPTFSPLNSQGFGDALKYFSKWEMIRFAPEYLYLGDYNNSDGGQVKSESQFLRGLSSLTYLQYLSLFNCNISGRLDFDTLIPQKLQHLQEIDLSLNNITEIGENVFAFDGGFGYLYITLDRNKLTESSFHPNYGIARPGRKTTLNLWHNQITSLPALIFQPFFHAHSKNLLQLAGNPLVCDERLSWIKSRGEEEVGFRQRVAGARCSNDRGRSIFESELIP